MAFEYRRRGSSLSELLEPYGAPQGSVVELYGDPEPKHARYLNLCDSGRRGLLAPHGVVEIHDGPLAYVVDATKEAPSAADVGRLCHVLAYRSDAPYLTVIEPGRLKVYGISLTPRGDQEPIFQVPESRSARETFPRLHLQPPAERDLKRLAVQDVLFRLFTAAVERLEQEKVSRNDAISLAGRAVFTRFLVDRGILSEADLVKICPTTGGPEKLFSDACRAEETSAWLDATFNGDFLPFVGTDFHRLGKQAFWHLDNIMRRTPEGQQIFEWAQVDFSYVPVEVLSQVYEWSAEKWDSGLRKQQGMYFTPLRIARYMVREVFAGLETCGPVSAHEARVLDPAVGGGVFLVAAFREIFAARWRHQGSPPGTRQIRAILSSQLTGFDIHEPALRLAALGLYLTSIELDLKPRPVKKLRFEPLQGKVLLNVRPPHEPASALTVGSLAFLDDARCRDYDVVIGNPPWTSLNDDRFKDSSRAGEVHEEMVRAIRPIAERRLDSERAKQLKIPDLVPDLPFVWAAINWARPDGWISFALHARLLFKASSSGKAARSDLFDAVDVTGVLNGADLRNTDVWPKVQAPFCLLFARNRRPKPHSEFYFVSPYREKRLNSQSRLRIDAVAAQPIASSSVSSEPGIMKALFRGTAFDVSILRKVNKIRSLLRLEIYWKETLGLHAGQGYQRAGDPNDASFLSDYSNLDTECSPDFLINPKHLALFPYATLHRPRNPEIYLGPLLVIRKSPPLARQAARAHVCFSNLAYSESFYGYSAARALDGDGLVRYVTLLLNSDFFLWYALMTSGEFGVERDAVEKIVVDEFPVIPMDGIEPELAGQIFPLSEALFAGQNVWWDIDKWIGEIYDLDRWDLEVIRDTLSVNLPFAEVRNNAERPPTRDEITQFAGIVQRELGHFISADRLDVYQRSAGGNFPWEILVISLVRAGSYDHDAAALAQIFEQADATGASQIVIPEPETGRILVAILRRYRYWTPTRARLLALEIIEEHLEKIAEAAIQ